MPSIEVVELNKCLMHMYINATMTCVHLCTLIWINIHIYTSDAGRGGVRGHLAECIPVGCCLPAS